jgi:hypothetical protein
MAKLIFNAHNVQRCLTDTRVGLLEDMGRGFGRGAKSVAIVTHAQMKGKVKLPKGLRVSKKRTKRAARRGMDHDDPNHMLNTRANDSSRGGAGAGKKPSSTMQRLDAQIASISFQENVLGRGRLKHLRKQIVGQVRDLRRKHHKRQEKINARAQENLAHEHKLAVDARNADRAPRQRRNPKYAAPAADDSDDSE